MNAAPFYHFFTLWVLLISILHKYTSHYIDIFFLAILVCVMGSYVSFVDPGYISFSLFGENYLFKGWTKVCVVDATHLLLFLGAWYCWSIYGTNGRKIINSIILSILYMFLVDVKKVYNVSNMNRLATLGVITLLLYGILVKDSLL